MISLSINTAVPKLVSHHDPREKLLSTFRMQLTVFSQPFLWALASTLHAAVAQNPLVTTVNGTYKGVQLPSWNQDAFLGVPFAQPPIKDLRWRWPQSLNESFSEVRDATQQGYSCMQFRGNFNMSEDCLNLNVVRLKHRVPRSVRHGACPSTVDNLESTWAFGW